MNVGNFPAFFDNYGGTIMQKLRGVLNYYMMGVTFREVRELDSRMRLFYWKQWGRPRARRLNLLKLGVPRDRVKLASQSRKGHWRISNVEIVRNALNNPWLESQGLPSLETQWVAVRYPQESIKTT